jgi:PKD repeat protein
MARHRRPSRSSRTIPISASLAASSPSRTGGPTYVSPGLSNLTTTVKVSDGSTLQVMTYVGVSLASAEDGTPDETARGFTSGVEGGRVPWRPSPPRSPLRWRPTSGRQSIAATALPPQAVIQATPAVFAEFDVEFHVVAGHDYAQPGTDTATLTVVGADGLPEVITVGLAVSVPPPPAPTRRPRQSSRPRLHR